MKAVIYCRVSTKEQTQNLSLPTQKKACLEYCSHQNIAPDKIFIDEGESAKTAARPEFQKMLKYCRENKSKVGHVVVYSLSRFSRNTHDHLQIKAYLAGLGVSLRSVTEPIDNTSAGKLMETILSGFAQFDNDVKSERTKAGMKAAIERGRWPWIAPIGYLNDNGPKGQSNLIPDPDKAPLIKKTFELYATGLYNRPQVLKMANNLGLKTCKGKQLKLQNIEKILRNPIYTGWIQSQILLNPVRGTFKPLIEQKLFDKVQAVLEGRKINVTSYLRNNPDFPLRRFVKCQKCSSPLTGSLSKGKTKKYPYYRCSNTSCRSVNIRREKLEEKFVEYLNHLKPKPEYVKLFEAIVLDRWRDMETEATAQSRSLQKHVDELRTKKERLEEAFIYEKSISKATYDDQLDKLNEKIALAEIEAHSAKLEAFDIEAALSFAKYLILNAERMWMESDLDQRQRLQKVLFPEGVYFGDGEFGTPRTCIFFNMLQELVAPKSKVASPRGFEPLSLE